MRFHFVASAPHFHDHLAPVWEALDSEEQGEFVTTGEEQDYGRGVFTPENPPLKARLGKARHRPIHYPAHAEPGDLLVVASMRDFKDMLQAGYRVAYVTHGVGQTYDVEHESYSGSIHPLRAHAAGFVVVNERTERAIHAVHPHVPVRVVGAPMLDAWHAQPLKPRDAPPVVTVSFHWESLVCPETRTAWPHYMAVLPDLLKHYTVLGHAHPRIWATLFPMYVAMGIEPVQRFDEVVARSDVYVCDNSSTIYEFASLGRPVVLLNAPWYRRNVEHGLRFWDAAGVGIQVSEPADLIPGIDWALEDDSFVAETRETVLDDVIPMRDGHASERAADALREFAEAGSA